MKLDSKIYVAGHKGLVGSAITRELKKMGFTNIVTRSSKELDLRDQKQVELFFQQEQPKFIFLAAAKVGGIKANNDYPADFIYDNLMIQTNVIQNAYKYGVKKLLFLGSSCIYPKMCPQPIKEEYLLTGALEPTNDAYAIAKIAGIKMCQSYNKQYGTQFIACMPTNLYGPHDNFNPITSHVMPALLRKFYEAKKENKPHVTIWGSGSPYREFLHVNDLAKGCIFLMQNYNGQKIVNIGTGLDLTIKDLALTIKNIIGYQGKLVFDTSKPDGTPKKQLNIDRIRQLGWSPTISLVDGIKSTIQWCVKNKIFD
ncbi:GDP-L-fucose synthase family protein [Candidatus Dependentiae bacterium]